MNTIDLWDGEKCRVFDDTARYSEKDADIRVKEINELARYPGDHLDGFQSGALSLVSGTIKQTVSYHRQGNQTTDFSGRVLNLLCAVYTQWIHHDAKFIIDVGITILKYPDISALESIMEENLPCFGSTVAENPHHELNPLLQKYRLVLLCVVLAGADYDVAVEYFRSHVTPDVNVDLNLLALMVHPGDDDSANEQENLLDSNLAYTVRKVVGELGERAIGVPDTATMFLRKAFRMFNSGVLSDDSDFWGEHYRRVMELGSDDIFYVLTSVFSTIPDTAPPEESRKTVFREIDALNAFAYNGNVVCSPDVPASWVHSVQQHVAHITDTERLTSRREITASMVNFYLYAVPDKHREKITANIDHVVSTLVDTALMTMDNDDKNVDYSIMQLLIEDYEEINWQNHRTRRPRPYHLSTKMMEHVWNSCGDNVDLWLDAVCAMMLHGVSRFSDVPMMNVILTDPRSVGECAHQWLVDIAANA